MGTKFKAKTITEEEYEIRYQMAFKVKDWEKRKGLLCHTPMMTVAQNAEKRTAKELLATHVT